jgi:hypothetical protein
MELNGAIVRFSLEGREIPLFGVASVLCGRMFSFSFSFFFFAIGRH